MVAIQYRRSIPRFLFTRHLGKFLPQLYTGRFACIALMEVEEPHLPTPSWVRIRTRLCGICGSDLGTIQAKGSYYMSALTSFPFTLGHEIVGEVGEVNSGSADFSAGDRVIIEPVLSCVVRGIQNFCPPCQKGDYGNCYNITEGPLAAGVQTGFCKDTGGGWSPSFVAHPFQVHSVPRQLSDEEAVLIEPFSCAIHAVLQAGVDEHQTILVIGCGTMGLLTIAALRATGMQGRIVVVAKYPHQAALAKELGADEVIFTGRNLYEAVRTVTGAKYFHAIRGRPVLIGGFDTSFDCIGSTATIDDALHFTKSRGSVLLVGMPAIPRGIDWTPIWYKELLVQGTYTYGTELYQGRRIRTFELAISLMEKLNGALKPLITGSFSIEDYNEAVNQAMRTGPSLSIKTVFKF